MKFVVTGATGFIGKHVVPALLARGHRVVALSRDANKARSAPWFDEVDYVSFDIHAPGASIPAEFDGADGLIHLAWPGLPNYMSLYHFEDTLPADYRFLKAAVESGVRRLIVTGTCLEYGDKSGCLTAGLPTEPVSPYALAKDTLRKFLEALQVIKPFELAWLRMFYLYGPGQNPNSLLAQLERAIDRGDAEFNMSAGDQMRDYLPVETAAGYIATIAESEGANGLFNCCSGTPITLRDFVQARLAEKGAKIKLNLGALPGRGYEPHAFWGDPAKLQGLG